MQQGDERRRLHIRAADQVADPAEQEEVVTGIGAVDRQRIGPVVLGPGVETLMT